MCAALLWLLGCYFYVTHGTAAANVTRITISPTEAAGSPDSRQTVMCKSDRRLEGCNFRVWFTDTGSTSKLNQDYPVMDFSRGTNSLGVEEIKFVELGSAARSGTVLYRARYHGEGLEEGECGLEFIPLVRGKYLVACRGKAVNQDWGYEFMALDVKYGQQPAERDDPRQVGTTLTSRNRLAHFQHSARPHHLLSSCTLFLPEEPGVVLLDKRNSRWSSPGRYEAVLTDKSCSLTLGQMTEQDNGVRWFSATAIRDNTSQIYESLLFKFLIIPKAPSGVVIRRRDHEGPFSPGDELTASCSASNSRPVADMSWLLGGETIRQDAVNQDSDTAWRWPWDGRSIKQILRRTLKSGDNGTVLTCRVKHEMLQEDLEDSLYLDVQGD